MFPNLHMIISKGLLSGLLALTPILVCQCAGPAIIIQHAEPGYSADFISNQTLSVDVDYSVRVLEFKKTFESRFSTGENYASEIRSEICNSLKEIKGLNIVGQNSGNEAAPKFTLKISDVMVSNNVQSSGTVVMMSPRGGGMMMAGGGSSEACIVSFDAELMQVDNGKSIWKIGVTGSSTVFLFAFEAALLDATSTCVNHLCNFVKTGVVE